MRPLAALRAKARRALARRLGVPEIEPALRRLAVRGFTPEVVFDVGAYRGDFARICRSIWPRVNIACFEPQPGALASLDELARHDRRLTVHPVLLGSASRDRVLLHEVETASSVLSEHVNQDHPTAMYPMRTIDEVVDEKGDGRGPDLLKIDVQGYELEVLKGAERSLPRVQAILVEVNLIDIHRGAPLEVEVGAWLAARGFVAYDICGLTRRPLDDALWQADVMFVPTGHPLRRDRRWSATAPPPR